MPRLLIIPKSELDREIIRLSLGLVINRRIAERLGVPAHYVQKVIGRWKRHGAPADAISSQPKMKVEVYH